MTHRSSFGVANARDFFHQIVLPQYKDFLANNSSPRHALLAIIVAYHMFEWVHPGRTFKVSRFESMYPSNKALANVFELAKNITNGTKHFLPKAETRAHGGFGPGFGPGFGDGFARPRLIVTIPDGTEQSADDFLRQIVDFWRRQERAGAF